MVVINTAFKIGTLLHTSSINETAKSNPVFALFLMHIISRHKNNDWGDCSESDWRMNNEAVLKNNRIISVYHLPQDLQSIHPDGKIWIVTEWDRKYTTILYPSEY